MTNARPKTRVLLLQHELFTWERARMWGYNMHVGLEEGMAANNIEVTTLLSTWFPRAREICAGRKFDQVWICDATHMFEPGGCGGRQLGTEDLEWLAAQAPVRVGLVVESLNYTPREYRQNPALHQIRATLERTICYFTHVLTPDEKDIPDIQALGGLPTALMIAPVPGRLVARDIVLPSDAKGAFCGTPYGERARWLAMPELSELIRHVPSAESDTNLPALFDQLHGPLLQEALSAQDSLLPLLYSRYLETLREIRRRAYEMYLQRLQSGYAVVNLPSYGKIHTARVYEGMAAGRPVVSMEIDERPRLAHYFPPGRDLLVYPKGNPQALVGHLQALVRDRDYAQQIAAQGNATLAAHHTSEKRVGQLLHWIRTGEEHALEPKAADNTAVAAATTTVTICDRSSTEPAPQPTASPRSLRILFVSPPFSRFMGLQNARFPITFGSMATLLAQQGHIARIYDADFDSRLMGKNANYEFSFTHQHLVREALDNHQHPVWKEIADTLRQFRPDVVGLTTMTSKYPMVVRIAEIIKALNPAIKVVVGGHHVSVLGERILDRPEFDFAVVGEGEITMSELANRLARSETDFANVRGLIYRADGKAVATPPRELLRDLDSLPMADRSLMLNQNFVSENNIIASRGCPFRCSYCGADVIWKHKVRRRSVANIVEEVQYLIRRSGSRHVNFWDDSFTHNSKFIAELMAALKQIPGLTFSCITRLDLVDRPMLELLKSAGCVNMLFGIESGNDGILGLVNKGLTRDKLKAATALVDSVGIPWIGFFIMGYPGETRQTILQTLEFMRELNPPFAEINIFNPLPGTPIWDELVKQGRVQADMDFSRCSQASTENPFASGMTPEEFRDLALTMAREFDRHNAQRPQTQAAPQPAPAASLTKIEAADDLYTRALDAMQQGRWQEGAQACARIIQQSPNNVEILLLLARCFFETGDPQTTREISKRVLELDPANEIALENLRLLDAPPQSSTACAAQAPASAAPKAQPGSTTRLPIQVHFLLNDKCNARCVMCGGDYYRSRSGRRITLDKFKTMAANLGLERFESITLAGAGDPLLNPDLIPIVEWLSANYPGPKVSITTNGIGLGPVIEKQLLRRNIHSLNISINAATKDTHFRVMQLDAFDVVLANARKLVAERRRLGKRMQLQFSSAIHRHNIQELPALIELAAEIGFDSVNTMYCRFYPPEIRQPNLLKPEHRLQDSDSLFFHQELSDKMVRLAEQRAAALGIAFTHEPLFSDTSHPGACIWPESSFMVGFDGEVYPCGGAELQFKKKVEAGVYHFGNALTETLEQFWNGEHYRALRLSSRQGPVCLTSECRNCANLMQPTRREAHIMQWHGFAANAASEAPASPSAPAAPHAAAKVSVIIPCYNQAGFLPEAVASVVSQTFTDWEIVIVNDGSTDDTNEVARKLIAQYPDREIRLLGQSNRGLAGARNAGIAASRGAYILPLDADDKIHPDMLAKTITLLDAHPEIGIAYTDYEFFGHENRVVRAPEYDWQTLCSTRNLFTCCSLFRRVAWEAAGGYNSNMIWGYEDWDFWIGCGEHGFVGKRIPEALFLYRTKQSSMVTGAQKHEWELRARMVLNHPRLFNAESIAAAQRVWDEASRLAGKATPPTGDAPKAVEPVTKAATLPAPASSATRQASLLVLCFNQLEMTKKCVAALQKNTPENLYELILVDNASTDGTREFLAQLQTECANVRVVTNQENLGFVGGNNVGALLATTPNLVFLNNDTEPQPGWLEALLDALESQPRVGAVGAKLVYPDGRLQEAGGIIFSDASGWNYGRGQSPKDPRFNFLREVDYCSGACLLVRRELFAAAKGFDTRYAPAYYEDADLCFWLRQEGWRVLYQPASVIIHHEGATAGTNLQVGFKRYQTVNQAKFRDKWRAALRQQYAPAGASVVAASDRRPGKRVLVVDAIMPMYDLAAGSRRMDEILRLLASGGHKVTFIALKDANGQRYAPALQRLGIEVYVGDPGRMKQLGFQSDAWRFDFKQLLAERNFDKAILSFWYVAELYLADLAKYSPRTKIYVDTVDVHFVRELRQAELEHNSQLLAEATERKRRELQTYARADALIAVTPTDQAALLKELPEATVKILPLIHPVAAEVPPFAQRQGVLFVGNFAHTPNLDAVLFFHQQVWPRLKAKVPGIKFTIVGNNPPPAVLALAGEGVKVTGRVPETEPYLRSHRVSVAPLRYGAGMKGKIGEALAAGLPVVTTSVGAEGMSNGAESPFVVTDDPAAFADAVVTLYQGESAWNDYSARGRRHIQKHYTPDAVRPELDEIIGKPFLTSIIILARNGLAHTRLCLDSVREHTTSPYELILVDNGSTDGTAAYFQDYAHGHPRVRVILNHSNRGFAAGNNQALALARGDYAVLLNNDTVVTAGWLEGLIRVFEQHPGTGIAGPMSNRVVGPQLVAQPGYQTLAGLPQFAAQWRQAHAGESEELNRVIGFCLMMRREVVERIGGLDERFGSGNFEDDDYCLRAAFSGFKIRVAKEVFIHHTGGQTFKGAGIDYRQAMLTNWGLFKAKWAMPADLPVENGYPTPTSLPPGFAIACPLPDLTRAFVPSEEGRCWTDPKPSQETAAQTQTSAMPEKKPATKSASAVPPPPCVQVGNLTKARELLNRKASSEAWQATCAAIAARPFHPQAYLLLAEIAKGAGDSVSARLCAEHARRLAPRWKPASQFLNRNLKGGARPEWLKLPASLSAPAPRLSVCLIARNEEKFLARCLKSVKDIANQIVLVDTGSTDRTVDIAREHGAEVHQFTWCDDFSAARNAALEHATGDWVLVLDADEELSADGRDKLRKALAHATTMAWRLPIVDVGREAEGCSYVPRLFRNAPGLFFIGRIHEQVFTSLEPWRQAWGLENRLGEATLLHHGYTSELTRDRNKVERNLRLLDLAIQDQPNDPHLLMNLGLELSRAGRETESVERYREAFNLLTSTPPAQLVPELRETLLAQYCTRLTAGKQFEEVARVLTSPLARACGGLSASLHFTLGLAHLELGQFRQAAEQMESCLAKRQQRSLCLIHQDIHTAAPHHCLALCRAQLGDAAGAEKAFQEGLKQTGHVDRIRLDYANFLFEQNRPVEALQCLNEAVAQDGHNAAFWRLGGKFALSRPDFLEFACDWTGEAIRHLPNDPVIVAQHAEALLLSGKTLTAAELWQQLWQSERQPAALAAVILCDLLQGPISHCPQDAAETAATGRAFLDWYRKCVSAGAKQTIVHVNTHAEALRPVLPEAARIIEAVTAEADRACAVASWAP